MVRTFLKHSEEAEDDEELQNIVRALYDTMLALGPAWKAKDGDAYVRQARKKIGKLRTATDQFTALQLEISTHTNFQMAADSLRHAVQQIEKTLAEIS